MIKLDLTVEQINLVLAALSKLPYEAVHTLIPNIQAQAQVQLDTPAFEE